MSALSLRLKPFGKDGVRILYAGGGADCTLEAHRPIPSDCEPDEEGWTFYAGAPDPEGVIVVKAKVLDGPAKLVS